MKATHKIVASLVAVALLVVLEVGASFWAFGQIEVAAGARRHAVVVLSRANELLSALRDAETGQRGYSLTGKEVFLEPYLAVRGTVSGQLEELRRLTSIGAASKHLDILGALIDAKLAEMARIIELRRHHDLTTVLAVESNGRGKAVMDSIRAEMRDFIQIEEAALAQRDVAFRAKMRQLFVIIVGISLLTLLFAFAFGNFLYRDALLKTGSLQSAIFNSANFSCIATDAKGVIQIFNVGAERMLGYTAADVMNKITPADISDPQEVIARAEALSVEFATPITPGFEALVFKASRGIEDIYELTYIRQDSSRFSAVVSVTALRDAQRAIIGYLLIGTDNTARRQVEAEQKLLDQALREKNIELESARAVAEQANHAKSEFLSSMSHELRSPLNAILGFAQLMDSDTPPPTDTQQDSIAQILKAGWHLLKLINEVLDLAKVESGQVPMSHEPVSLTEVALECQGMIEPEAQLRGIRCSFPPADLPHFVQADRTRLKQVLINLLSNALKYNVNQGTVELKCVESTPGRVRVSISDTGAGLSPAQCGQLFQAFNRLGQEAGGEEGTGIGLVVAKRLVELMGGSIGMDSTVGVGSVFWFELAAAAAPHLPVARADASASDGAAVKRAAHTRTLLYVEDNPANLALVKQLIGRQPDMHLLSATDGYSGIAAAREAQPDIILLDINLPDIDGYAVLKVLAADPLTAHIPVVAVSANAMPRDIKTGLEAGFLRYITKPIQIDEFTRTLAEVLDLSRSPATSAEALTAVPHD